MAFQRQAEISVTTRDGDGIEISGLRVDFDIERTDSREVGQGTIRVWNLSEGVSTRVSEAGGRVMLRAGYMDETAATVYVGDIARGTRERIGNDYVTTLEAYDGRKAVMAGRVSLSYAKGADAADVARDLLGAIGLPFRGHGLVSGALPHGWCFFGMAADGLCELLAHFDLTYTVQDETLYIMRSDAASHDTGLRLSADDGSLLSVPQPVNDVTAADDDAAEAKNRWAFSAKPNPQLSPGAAVTVSSPTFNCDAVVRRVRLHGGNMDGEFRCDIEAEAL